MLRVIQPGLAGLMDGSVSTLAPVFAAAFATGRSLGRVPGRDGSLGRRRHLDGVRRGAVGQRQPDRARGAVDARADLRADDDAGRHRPHAAVPDPEFPDRDGRLAVGVVIVELGVITWIRWRYMDTPPFSAAMQVGFGGALVFATGILIGNS